MTLEEQTWVNTPFHCWTTLDPSDSLPDNWGLRRLDKWNAK